MQVRGETGDVSREGPHAVPHPAPARCPNHPRCGVPAEAARSARASPIAAERGGRTRRRPRIGHGWRIDHLWRQPEGHERECRGPDEPVGHRVVVGRKEAKGPVIDRFDDLDSPRWPIGIEGAGQRVDHQLPHLLEREGKAGRMRREVVADVEVGVLLQVREPQGAGDVPHPQPRRPHRFRRVGAQEHAVRMGDDLLEVGHRAVRSLREPKPADGQVRGVPGEVRRVDTAEAPAAAHLVRASPPTSPVTVIRPRGTRRSSTGAVLRRAGPCRRPRAMRRRRSGGARSAARRRR